MDMQILLGEQNQVTPMIKVYPLGRNQLSVGVSLRETQIPLAEREEYTY
jgi:hypothetical protein